MKTHEVKRAAPWEQLAVQFSSFPHQMNVKEPDHFRVVHFSATKIVPLRNFYKCDYLNQ